MEKMMVYNLRPFDELPVFEQCAAAYGFELHHTPDSPTLENAHLADGCRCVNIITTPINRELMQKFKACGVEYLVTRTIGYDHIDLHAAKECGIRVANTSYFPDGVAEYSLMLMLMCVRKMKSIQQRFAGQDYTLMGLLGGELSSMTVGIIGTGNIGKRLCEMLSGFGCRVLAYSPTQNVKTAQYANYVPLEQLLQESDVISLHASANAHTFHMINADTIAQMKDGVVLINTARGSLIDTNALIDGLNRGKIGAVGLDVLEDESALFYYDRREEVLPNTSMYQLQSYPNVIITHHMAFYTREAVESMVKNSMLSASIDRDGQENPWQVKL